MSFKRCLERIQVRLKCNFAALRKSSDDQQQHCQHHHKAGYWSCGIRFIDLNFGKFNSLRNTLRDSRSNISISLCLLFNADEETLKTNAHTRSKHNKEDDDLQLFISPFTTARKIAGIYWVSSHVSVTYLVRFIFYFYTIII